MSPEIKQDIRMAWSDIFYELENSSNFSNISLRILTGIYAVTSIAYHGNDTSFINDNTYDSLCKFLFKNFTECKVAGADKLDKSMLKANTGYDVKIFVKPYHDIVSAYLDRPCECIECQKGIVTQYRMPLAR